MADREPGEQRRLAAEALAAARAAARARGARPAALRRSPLSATSASLGPAAAPEPAADSAAPEAAARAMPAPQQGTAPGRGSVVSAEEKPDAGEPISALLSSGDSGRVGARPGFASPPRRPDPVSLSSAISGLLDAEGWGLSVATGSVFGRWADIVGSDLAGHTRPERLADGELTVQADSTAWATQVRLLAAQLVRRLNQELGDGTVLRVKVRGPAAADRKPGQWRVRGSRGPRDTYG